MAPVFHVSLLGVLLLAGTVGATTVGPAKGRPVGGRPLEVNIPFTVDTAAERACASANVRYGSTAVPRTTLAVQGQGPKRNLLVTSHAKVTEPTVTVNVRVGCGAKAVTRSFVLAVALPAGRPAMALAAPVPKPVVLTPAPVAEAVPPEMPLRKPDAPPDEAVRKAQGDAAAALAQLEATRKELAAVLEVERRTGQTLIQADHDVRNARSETARMRLLLQCVAGALALAAAGLGWFEFQRIASRWRPAAHVEPVAS